MPVPEYRKKLIEVDLPLDVVNAESAREKSIRHGHPSTLHLWWARRPLAACRAVIFASMVDDPSSCPEEEFPTEESRHAERRRLHDLIKELVKWQNINDENLLARARYEIARSIARSPDKPPFPPVDPANAGTRNTDLTLRYLRDNAPAIYDPFCGGGSIPLEAQRLGMKAVGSDLNPVAVLITKALIELPPKFHNQPPVNPDSDPLGMTTGRGRNKQRIPWRGTAGLANDIRYYGRWMREEAFRRIGRLYPKVKDAEGIERTVIAWLWTRTIPCPNPACGIKMPMMKTFQLSKKRGNQRWIRPIIDSEARTVSFAVQNHKAGVPETGTVNRNGATCIACSNTVRLTYVREQARAGKMGEQMTAIVAEGHRKRLFMSPTHEHIQAALDAQPEWRPAQRMPDTPTLVSGRGYGITHWHQLFTERQLLGLTTFSDLISEARSMIVRHGGDDGYADAVCTYLSLAVGRAADSGCAYARWQNSGDFVAGVFARQAIPMIWDFAEANSFSQKTQNWLAQIEWVAKAVDHLPTDSNYGEALQADASTTVYANDGPIIVTDPPYYDNMGYADLSDFFYVWLRPLLRDTYGDLFATISTPKDEEMIASPSRFNDSRQRFEDLLHQTLKLMRKRSTPDYPSSIFYAYKQQEEKRGGKASTGWETMLNALVTSGFQIIGTWPMRTERTARSNALGTNSLASSVVLVCRPRPEDAPPATRSQFIRELEAELPDALDHLTRESHIAPTDLAQAAIGPGMEIYSRYSAVETIAGEPVPVRQALIEINNVVARYFEQQEGELDSETRFCIDWLKGHGYDEGTYGEAEVLSQAKNIDIANLSDNHRLLTAESGKVQLLRMERFGPDRETPDGSMTTWESCMRMTYHMNPNREDGDGIDGAARGILQTDGNADGVERLARILYNHYDRRGESRRAYLFNNLVTNWQTIAARADNIRRERRLV